MKRFANTLFTLALAFTVGSAFASGAHRPYDRDRDQDRDEWHRHHHHEYCRHHRC